MSILTSAYNTRRIGEKFSSHLYSSNGASDWAESINQSLRKMPHPVQNASFSKKVVSNNSKPLEEQLFDTLAVLKILTSQFAMHLNIELRNKIFHQLDMLLDSEEWDEADSLPAQSSYKTFLRMMLHYGHSIRRPGLGLSSIGNIIAAWTVGNNRLTIECCPYDEIRWVLSHFIDGERESAAGRTSLYRLSEVLLPYNADKWLMDDKKSTR